jgi:hypothetical protein
VRTPVGRLTISQIRDGISVRVSRVIDAGEWTICHTGRRGLFVRRLGQEIPESRYSNPPLAIAQAGRLSLKYTVRPSCRGSRPARHHRVVPVYVSRFLDVADSYALAPVDRRGRGFFL